MPAPVKPGGLKLPAKIVGQKPAVVIVGVALAVGVGLYLRKHMGSGGGSASGSPALGGGDTSGGAGSSAASPADLTPVEDLAWAINGLTGVLGAGGSFGFGSAAGGDGSVAAFASGADASTSGAPAAEAAAPTSSAGAQAPVYQTSSGYQILTYGGPADESPAHDVQTGSGYGSTDANLRPSVPSGPWEPLPTLTFTPAPASTAVESWIYTATGTPQTIPAPPHNDATKVKPAPKPVSGYSEKSKANLH